MIEDVPNAATQSSGGMMNDNKKELKILKSPHERDFKAANLSGAPIKMRVSDEEGQESDISFSLQGYTVLEGLDSERFPVNAYQFQGITTNGYHDLNGQVIPGAKDKQFGHVAMFCRKTKQPGSF